MPFRRRLFRSAAGPAPGRGAWRAPAGPCLWVLLAVVAPAISATAEELPPLAEIRDETRRVTAAAADLDTAATRRAVDVAHARERLAHDEANLRAQDVRTDMLRAARLALDAATERSFTLKGQTAHQRTALAGLEQAVAALAQAPPLDASADTDLGVLRRAAALRLLHAQVEAQRTLVAALERLTAVNARAMILDGQRLRLLQARARLDALDDGNGPGVGELADRGAGARALEQVVTDSLRTASRLADELSSLDGQDPQTVARRQALETGVQDAATRAYLAQNALELSNLKRRLTGLAGLREDPSMPVALLRDAADRLLEIEAALPGYQSELAGQRKMLAARRALTGGTDDTAAEHSSAAADLSAQIGRQEQEVTDLLRLAGEESRRFDALAAEVYAQSLTDRHPFPMTGEEWRRVTTGALGLPALLVRELGFVGRDLRTRTAALAPADWASLSGGLLLIATGAWWTRRALRRRLVEPDPARALAIPAGALAAALPAAVPAALWAWVGGRIDLPRPEFLPLLLLLGIAPLSVFALALTRAALFGADPGAPRPPARAAYYRRLRRGLLLAAVAAVIYLLTSALPVPPLLGDVLDRFAMLGLLPLAWPAFGLYDLIQGRWRDARTASGPTPATAPAPAPGTDAAPGPESRAPRPRLGARLLGELARLIGIALVAAGLLGLLGYANLAWTISARLAWLAVVATLLYFVVGSLGDLRDLLGQRFAGADREFWQQQFLLPGHGLAVLSAWLVAGWALVHLWGLNADTPVVHALLDWAARPLLTTGKLSLTPWHLALAVLLATLALSSGAWVRQVSYQLTFGGVRDRGLRLALASLAQYLALLCGVLLALVVAGFDLTTLMVFIASLGVGIGFGLQTIVNNFISGILLLVERPLRVGDVVTVAGHEGEVTHIGFRSLTVRTFDKQEVIIPNGSVISADFINWTRSDDIVRTVLTVGIGYQDDPDRAIALVREILAGYTPVLREPAPIVSLWEFGDSAVVLRIEFCIHLLGAVRRTTVRSEVNRRIWYGFQAAGISIPFPQRDLHVRMLPAPDGPAAPPLAPE